MAELNENEPFSGLNKKQLRAIEYIKSGKNIFLTGLAGTGKTFVLQRFIETSGYLKYITITATTGIAAFNIQGSTVHSKFLLGLGNSTVEYYVKKITSHPVFLKRWTTVKTLIIDEISMLNAELFQKIHGIACKLRNNNRPFGGIQLVLCGDALQLPPIAKNGSYGASSDIKFFFEAPIWNQCNFKIVYLTEIIRQSDPKFTSILNQVRLGNITSEVKQVLEKCRQTKFTGRIQPTILYTTNKDVDTVNELYLSNLQKPRFKYSKVQYGFAGYEKLHTHIPETVELCLGAQVMLTTNLAPEAGLVNGSRGVIVNFSGPKNIPVVLFKGGFQTEIDNYTWVFTIESDEDSIYYTKTDLFVKQIPLRLAYAITVHKSQGSTLDCVSVNLSNLFDYSQAYVALSRVKNLESLHISGYIDYPGVKVHPKAKEFDYECSIGPIFKRLTDNVIDSSGNIHSVFPFPTAGGHHLVHRIVCDYLDE